MAATKRRKPGTRFCKYSFSLSDKEKSRYDRLCAHQKIGFKQLVKKALREYYRNADLQEPEPELENQLDLFEPTDLFGHPIRKRK